MKQRYSWPSIPLQGMKTHMVLHDSISIKVENNEKEAFFVILLQFNINLQDISSYIMTMEP